MSDDRKGTGWQAGKTFFEEAGGEPAVVPSASTKAGADEAGTDAGGGDLPASEAGTGTIPEDDARADVQLPASEADEGGLTDAGQGEPQSWPGGGGPGSFPPPG